MDTPRQNEPLLIIISAPSGGGKTTLCQQLLSANPATARAITCTTRAPRPGEVNGVDYYFLGQVEFAQRVEAGDFLEHANVHGNNYGTLKSEVLEKLGAGRDVLLAIDVQGAATVRARAEADAELRRRLLTVFLAPTSLDVLEARLKKRAQDAPEVIQRRMDNARREMAEWSRYDYVIITSSIAEDLRRMQVILEAEKMRTHRTHLSSV